MGMLVFPKRVPIQSFSKTGIRFWTNAFQNPWILDHINPKMSSKNGDHFLSRHFWKGRTPFLDRLGKN